VRRGDTRFEDVTREGATPAHEERLADIIAFFTLGTAGNDPETAERMIPRVREVMRWLSYYQTPPFPGHIDAERADRGREVFARRCASCHGHYDQSLDRPHLIEYPNRLVRQAFIGTDSVRWVSVDDNVLHWQETHPTHPFVRHVDAARTGGYVAPILNGVWATAPYLHNGSVPTLWHLLHPESRPARFEVGGHRLDYERMGIALERGEDGVWRHPAGYTPRSRGVIYETSELGRSNRGHETPLKGMSEAEKAAVLEYLKTL
jgi:mono/diheme cytochrome c family protein